MDAADPRDTDSPPRPGLFELVHEQLRVLAAQKLGDERRGHTLQATALVNEAWLRLAGREDLRDAGEAGFFAAAAEAMRRILIDHARARGRAKRGAGRLRVPLEALELVQAEDDAGILSVDDALRRLEEKDARMAEVVKLRFFAGLTEAQVGEVLGISDRTVRREWTLARAWLQRELL